MNSAVSEKEPCKAAASAAFDVCACIAHWIGRAWSRTACRQRQGFSDGGHPQSLQTVLLIGMRREPVLNLQSQAADGDTWQPSLNAAEARSVCRLAALSRCGATSCAQQPSKANDAKVEAKAKAKKDGFSTSSSNLACRQVSHAAHFPHEEHETHPKLESLCHVRERGGQRRPLHRVPPGPYATNCQSKICQCDRKLLSAACKLWHLCARSPRERRAKSRRPDFGAWARTKGPTFPVVQISEESDASLYERVGQLLRQLPALEPLLLRMTPSQHRPSQQHHRLELMHGFRA